jgi:uncharacterized RDD family membrane protein YckC
MCRAAAAGALAYLLLLIITLLIRYIGYYLSTIPLLLGLIWVAVDPRKQGWHDKLAGTAVVSTASSMAQGVAVRPEQESHPTAP